ncbi:MAG: hypothetical protein HDT28_02780 [Clostridiales bacterium]|nr:hypothetical protein [Clostridiales bacterium]
MIKQFDKHGAAALYKRKFGEAIDGDDYEKAFDYLLRFTEEVDNPDFHMACGMLYLLMIQESDDREFLTLAFREFMFYLVDHPDSRMAYRNILATVLLRREARPLIEWSEFIKNKGFDLEEMLGELSSAGIDVFTGESEYLDIGSMFLAGEFGLIDSQQKKPTDEVTDETLATEAVPEQPQKQENKIIKFRGEFTPPQKVKKSDSGEPKALKFGDGSAGDDGLDAFDFIMQMLKGDNEPTIIEGDDDGFSIDIDVNDSSPQKKEELRARLALVEAENACAVGKYDDAIASLNKITERDGHLYYCGECVRAYILLEQNDISGAQAALDKAFSVNPRGALAGTLQCKVYELTGNTDRIPGVLNNIDIQDYIDCDHVYKAMRLAIKYCTEENALDLAEGFIDEYNVMDIRLLYAQMLYNYGDKQGAIDELYALSRIFYDDFNVMFYHLMAKSDVPRMPLTEEAPQDFLGLVVDSVIEYLEKGKDKLDEDLLAVGLEMFLTLEFDNERKTTVTMFDALKKLAHMSLHREKVREALVSPYVEPLVKAVILGELFEQGEHDFLMEVGYCPIDGEQLEKPEREYYNGFNAAYAIIVTLYGKGVPALLSLADEVSDKAKKLGISAKSFANYLVRKVRGNKTLLDKSTDRRIDYALGFSSKTAAAQDYKATIASLDGHDER